MQDIQWYATVLSCNWVTIDGVFLHTYTYTCVHSHVFTSRCLVAVSNDGRSPYSGFPKYPRPQLPVAHCNSSQRLNFSSSLTDSLTDILSHSNSTNFSLHSTQLTLTNNSTRTTQKTLFDYCCAIVGVENACWRSHYLVTAVIYLLISRLLPSNGCRCHNKFKFGTFREKIVRKGWLAVVTSLNLLPWIKDLIS
jgi:hypothetical protein